MVKDDRGSAVWKYGYQYDCENVDWKSNTGAEMDRSTSSSFAQLLKSLKLRSRRESEAPCDDESKARHGDDSSQRDNAKGQKLHG